MQLQNFCRRSVGAGETGKAVALPVFPGLIREFFPILIGLFLVGAVIPAAAQTATPSEAQKPAAEQSAPPPAAQAPESKPTDAKPTDAKPADAKPADAAPAAEQSSPVPAASEAKPASDGQSSASKSLAESPAPSDAPPAPQGAAAALLPHDLSPYGMFMNADVIVQSVMVGLAFASFVTWTILLAKLIELFGARGRAKRALGELARAETLHEASAAMKAPKAPVSRLVSAALSEVERSKGLAPDGVKERAAALLARIEAHAGRAIGRGTGVLATIGSTAPFVGLFGTVWGIMNSFIGISKTNTTNLAVVAPGIAEALLATAFGLVAAIPAVVIYNMFARSITGYRSILNDASTEVLRLLSRDLDRASVGGQVRMTRQAAE